MKNIAGIAQFILRLALGTGFLIPVADRIGLMGSLVSNGVTWGDWKHFVDYTHTLVPFGGGTITNIWLCLRQLVKGYLEFA